MDMNEINHKNICRFVPVNKNDSEIQTVNFVLETKMQIFDGLKNTSLHKMHLVTKGTGILRTPGKEHMLKEGDIFFCIPSLQYAIESISDFEYMYISYLSSSASAIMDRLGINRQNYIFHDFSQLIPLWQDAIHMEIPEVMDLRTKGLLMYSFSVLSETTMAQNSVHNKPNTFLVVKKYIDDNYSDSNLSLSEISDKLSYSKKYISALFKANMDIGFSEYLCTLRIQHACTLIEQGFTSIKDISFSCGFKDQMYFSKVFKQKMGLSPSDHIAEKSPHFK